MIRLGRYQAALADVPRVDAVIVDPPYGPRTHKSEARRGDGVDVAGLAPEYCAWDEVQVREFVESWHPRCDGWIVALSCSDLAPVWRAEFEHVGRVAFAPVACVISGMSCRVRGDGPSSWTVYANVARPSTKAMASWGTLPGAYVGPAQHGAGGGRGKPAWLVDALVRDYSRPGDLVCDPCAGWGTTLLAALRNGRRAIGAEVDAEAHDRAARALAGLPPRDERQPDLFGGVA
jgi:hypothetical protein